LPCVIEITGRDPRPFFGGFKRIVTLVMLDDKINGQLMVRKIYFSSDYKYWIDEGQISRLALGPKKPKYFM